MWFILFLKSVFFGPLANSGKQGKGDPHSLLWGRKSLDRGFDLYSALHKHSRKIYILNLLVLILDFHNLSHNIDQSVFIMTFLQAKRIIILFLILTLVR